MRALCVLALFAVCAAALADPHHEILVSPSLSSDELTRIEKEWTPERKAAARGHPGLLSGGDIDRVRGPPHPEVLALLRDAGLLEEFGVSDAPHRTVRQYVDTTGLPDGTSKINVKDYGMMPFRATGRVFGHDPVGRFDFACSGALVGDSVVMTAGHCCGSVGVWNTQMVLDVQYQHGCGADCTAVAFDSMRAPGGWILQGYWQYDYCFAPIRSAAPRPTLGLAVLVSQARIYLACGYPTNTERDPGEYLYCTRNAQSTSVSGSKGIPSKLGEGASGGPWTIGTTIAPTTTGQIDTNDVNGLNSHIYPGKLVMYSPNFDSLTMQTYQLASADV